MLLITANGLGISVRKSLKFSIMKYVIELLRSELRSENTKIDLQPRENYDKETNEAILFVKKLSIKRISELEKAIKILKAKQHGW